jgi:peptide/nickel transport system ATP-binding protein
MTVHQVAAAATRDSDTADVVLSLRNLVLELNLPTGPANVVDDVSFDLRRGEILGLVGESGSGKTATIKSILRLINPPEGRIANGQILFEGDDLAQADAKLLRDVRGNRIAMVFQDALTAFNPLLTIGYQITETVQAHHPDWSKAQCRQRALDILEQVGVPSPKDRYRRYSNEYSGGMRQRAMIALALANEPSVVLADEPTTALDVTTQAQVIELLLKLQDDTGVAIIFVSHDLGIVAEIADRVAVMYAGRIIEMSTVDDIFYRPLHPYTKGLLDSIPIITDDDAELRSIAGQPPTVANRPSGCPFHPRCALGLDNAECRTVVPALENKDLGGGLVACHLADLSVDLSSPAFRSER